MATRARAIERRIGALILIAIGFGVLWIALEYRAHQRRDRQERLLNGEGVIAPNWRMGECRARSADEQRRDQAMIELLDRFPHRVADPGIGYVERYFAWHWRIVGAPGACPPASEHYRRIAAVLVPLGWPRTGTERFELELARWLPASAGLARNLAKLAFAPEPLPYGPLKYDNRPFARMMLAEQGSYARPWGARALAEIAPDTKLGTGAAVLAAATVPQTAAPRIAAAMREMIAQAEPRRERIKGLRGGPHVVYQVTDSERLTELADALGTAGAAAEPHAAPLIQLLGRSFGSGSHFGLLPSEPRPLCAAAERIGGRAAAAARERAFCRDAALARARVAR
jgi:hypothetical protein